MMTLKCILKVKGYLKSGEYLVGFFATNACPACLKMQGKWRLRQADRHKLSLIKRTSNG
jgi:hypothetical protein